MDKTKKDKQDAIQAVAGFMLLPVLFSLRAYATMWCWLWFIVPLGAPAIEVGHALGLVIFASILRQDYREKEPEELLTLVGRGLVVCSTTWLSAWVVYRILVAP